MSHTPYEATKLYIAALVIAVSEASKAINSIPGIGSGQMGLTPDSVKATPEYRKAKMNYDFVWNQYQAANRCFVKYWSKEIRADREAMRSAKVA